jgi:hypothetical protein
MAYIGKTPSSAALTSSDISDGIISTVKIANDATTLAKMASGTDGNIISYDASGNPVAVATGSDGQVLTSTGAGSPPAFEAIPGGGKVLQVVTTNITTAFTTTSTSFTAASGFSVAITPSATSSKVLIFVNTTCQNSAANGKTNITVAKGTSVLQANGFGFHSQGDGGDNTFFSSAQSFNYLDSPSTTSSTTYGVYFFGETGTASINYNNSVGVITAMEIGA